MAVEPNDHKLPLGGKLYGPIKRSFDAQGKLIVERLRRGYKSAYFTPAELLGPQDPQLRDELPAIVPTITGIWDKSGRRLYAELGFDPDRWRVTSEFLRASIYEAANDFCVATQETFRTDFGLTYDAIREEIRKEIDAGRLQSGESMPQLTTRLLKYFQEGNRWRARRIAQTEATRAHHLARERSAKETGVVLGWEWVTTSASCPVCDAIARDVNNKSGKRLIKLGQAFAINGTNPTYRVKRFPPAHPHCVLGETPVRVASLVAASHAKYQGPIVRIECRDGSRFAVTPNHMLLTVNGFMRAADIMKGDNVVRACGIELSEPAGTGASPDVNDRPRLAHEVFAAFAESGGVTACRVPVSPEYLHGDAAFCDREIDVVRSDRFLRNSENALFGQPVEHLRFEGGMESAGGLSGGSGLTHALERLRLATDGGVGRTRELGAILLGRLRHSEVHGFGSAAGDDADTLEFSHERRARNTHSLRNALDGLAPKMGVTDVINVDFDPGRHETHSVYDFETLESMYIIGNGIVSSNCRCTTKAIVDPLYTGDPVPIQWSSLIDFTLPAATV